jgi:UDP-glucose 4-epimerase
LATIVVTGATGYVGGRLVQHLRESGADVRTIGRRRAPPWLAGLTGAHHVLDITQEDPTAACDGADAVIHLAAPNEVEAQADPAGAIEATVAATRHVAAALAATGVPRLVYLSTMHVYGDALVEDAVVTETTSPAPRHPYAEAHLASEATSEQAVPGQLVVLRMTNAIGAPAAVDVNRWSLVVNDLCRQAVTAGQLVLHSSGDQWRDFLAMEDAVRIISACGEPENVPVGTYNLGSGRPTTIKQIAEMVQHAVERQTRQRPPLSTAPATGPAPRPYRVDVSKLGSVGLEATTDIADAIDETVAFCIAHRGEMTA